MIIVSWCRFADQRLPDIHVLNQGGGGGGKTISLLKHCMLYLYIRIGAWNSGVIQKGLSPLGTG